MQVESRPYELLARWDQDGTLLGAHVQWRHVIKDDNDAVVGESLSQAEPVNIGQGNGYPLADILDQTTADALISLAGVTAARDAEATARVEAEAALAEALARIAELEGQGSAT